MRCAGRLGGSAHRARLRRRPRRLVRTGRREVPEPLGARAGAPPPRRGAHLRRCAVSGGAGASAARRGDRRRAVTERRGGLVADVASTLRQLLGEGVLSASFIPVDSRLLAEGRHEEAGRVAGAIAGLVAAAAAAVTVLDVLLAEPLTLLIAPGFRSRPETYALTVDLVRILFPAVGFLVLSAWCLGVLNSHRRFFLSYIAPVVLNVVQVAVLVGVGSRLALGGEDDSAALVSLVTWLAVGTVVGGVLQFLVQLPAVLRVSRGLRPSLRTDLPEVRAVLADLRPGRHRPRGRAAVQPPAGRARQLPGRRRAVPAALRPDPVRPADQPDGAARPLRRDRRRARLLGDLPALSPLDESNRGALTSEGALRLGAAELALARGSRSVGGVRPAPPGGPPASRRDHAGGRSAAAAPGGRR